MGMVRIEAEPGAGEALQLVRSVIEDEIKRLTMALEMAQKRLQPFEEKYQVSSAHFINDMAAEDLVGGDEEYIAWAGEYHLQQRLVQKLQQLREIEYGDPGVFRTDSEMA